MTNPASSERDHQSVGGLPYGIIDPEYARIYTIARLLAWSEGYALMMHGSFTRDLDLVAIPWAENVCEPEHLVRRLLSATEDTLRAIHREDSQPGPASDKPHGRKVWTLVFKKFGDPRFVDLSVIPANAACLRGARSAMNKADDILREIHASDMGAPLAAVYERLMKAMKLLRDGIASIDGAGVKQRKCPMPDCGKVDHASDERCETGRSA